MALTEEEKKVLRYFIVDRGATVKLLTCIDEASDEVLRKMMQEYMPEKQKDLDNEKLIFQRKLESIDLQTDLFSKELQAVLPLEL